MVSEEKVLHPPFPFFCLLTTEKPPIGNTRLVFDNIAAGECDEEGKQDPKRRRVAKTGTVWHWWRYFTKVYIGEEHAKFGPESEASKDGSRVTEIEGRDAAARGSSGDCGSSGTRGSRGILLADILIISIRGARGDMIRP